jgi:prepilin-type processing-associated H-X9-DG protein
MYQIDTAAPTDVKTLSGNASYSEGKLLYKAHNNRFNYAFHDGHVETLKIESTIGTVSPGIQTTIRLQAPLGMWTLAVGD